MKVNKNIIISIVVTLVIGIGISAVIFKPLGTMITEKNNTDLYLQMKDDAIAEVKAEFDKQLEQVKKDTEQQINNLKAEYDKAISDAKLQQANDIKETLQQANDNAQKAIEDATSPQNIEQRRQEENKQINTDPPIKLIEEPIDNNSNNGGSGDSEKPLSNDN